jgi:hypothetical protein
MNIMLDYILDEEKKKKYKLLILLTKFMLNTFFIRTSTNSYFKSQKVN